MNPLLIGLLLATAFQAPYEEQGEPDLSYQKRLPDVPKESSFYLKREEAGPPKLGKKHLEAPESVFLRPVPPPDVIEEAECDCKK